MTNNEDQDDEEKEDEEELTLIDPNESQMDK